MAGNCSGTQVLDNTLGRTGKNGWESDVVTDTWQTWVNVLIARNVLTNPSGKLLGIDTDSYSGVKLADNVGYTLGYIANPFLGIVKQVVDSGDNATMTSAWVYTNVLSAKVVYVTGGTVTVIAVNGQTVASAATTMSLVLKTGDTFSITFSSAPTIKVFG